MNNIFSPASPKLLSLSSKTIQHQKYIIIILNNFRLHLYIFTVVFFILWHWLEYIYMAFIKNGWSLFYFLRFSCYMNIRIIRLLHQIIRICFSSIAFLSFMYEWIVNYLLIFVLSRTFLHYKYVCIYFYIFWKPITKLL